MNKENKFDSISSKLKSKYKVTKEFEAMLSTLSLEELIALKLEISARPLRGKMYLPLHKALIPMVKQAAVYFANSVTNSKSAAAKVLGLSRRSYITQYQKYEAEDFFKKLD